MEPFWTSLTKDFAALDASTFTPEQLERAKLNLEDDLYRSKETLSGLASKIGYFQFFMGGDQGERNAIEALRNVDNGMLKQVLAAWVQPDRLTTVVLPPKDAKMPDMQAHPRQGMEVRGQGFRSEDGGSPARPRSSISAKAVPWCSSRTRPCPTFPRT